MPPSHNPPVAISNSRHILQNSLLILLSLSFLPFTTFFILIPCLIRAYLYPRRKEIDYMFDREKLTILVTNTDMTKGLALCRAFKALHHRVIGADVVRDKPVSSGIQRPNRSRIVKWVVHWLDREGLTFKIPSPGRFSRALDAYHFLPDPLAERPRQTEQNGLLRFLYPISYHGHKATAASREDEASASGPPLIDGGIELGIRAFADKSHSLISQENIALWIPVSSVTTTVEEANSAAIISDVCRWKHFILPPSVAQMLHSKDTFIEHAESLGMTVPESHVCTSPEEVLGTLYGETTAYIVEPKPVTRKRFILKCIPLDDVTRANLTTYPLSRHHETVDAVSHLGISPWKPFLLQEYIEGQEYTTHGVIVNGRVTGFVACQSAELLMHYVPLNQKSPEYRAMLSFTETYASKLGAEVSGQVSFDFLVTHEDDRVKLYPIECNPRTHTAILLFSHDPKTLTEAYLAFVPGDRSSQAGLPHNPNPNPEGQASGYYWVGHDLVVLVLVPFLRVILCRGPLIERMKEFVGGVIQFVTHLLWWEEATWDSQDPLPSWWLYHVYWPFVFLGCLFTGRKWSRVNVSTGRVFECL